MKLLSENQSKYAIFQCSKCKRWIYARAAQKSSKCGFCQKLNPLPEHPQHSAEKPQEALNKIKSLNNTVFSTEITSDKFESKGKYKPFAPERPATYNHQKKLTKSASISNENKALTALRKFQNEKRIKRDTGIPFNVIPLIFRNAGLSDANPDILVKKLIAMGLVVLVNQKKAIYLL